MILFARCPVMTITEVKCLGWTCCDLLSPAFAVTGSSLGCRQAARMRYCKLLSNSCSLHVLLRAREIPDPVLSKYWQLTMHLCELGCWRSEYKPESTSAVSCLELSQGHNVTHDALLQEGLDHLMHVFWSWVGGEELRGFWAVPPRVPNVQSMSARREH